ncbi:MAG: VWA domain-containing protein [Pyrinomonadaceae bacterium]
MLKNKLCLLVCFCAVYSVLPVRAQNAADETVRIRTRVVFVDTLVQDKKTGTPIRDLTQDNFHVLDNGKPRTLTYFAREGDTRKRPLALVLLLDLEQFGAGRYLQQPEVLQSLNAVLAKLRPEDEVAVVGDFFGMEYEPISGFTRDRAQVAEALTNVPKLVALGQGKIKGDDSLLKVTPHIALEEVTRLATRERPNSQVVIVHITGPVLVISFKERRQLAAKLNRANVMYDAMTCQSDKLMKVLASIFKPFVFVAGGSMSGSANYFAQRTGGEALSVPDPKNYAAALEEIISRLSARYSLGFTLAEQERDDGRMHNLEVRVRARDEQNKQRQLVVNARRGYYLPDSPTGQQTKLSSQK